jgi:N-acetylneuraminic acid mutarotase
MRRRPPFCVAFILGLLALASCDEGSIPTRPEGPGDQPGLAPDFAWASNSWTARARMPTGRNGHDAAVVKNASGESILYAIGGYPPWSSQVVDIVEAYNYVTNTWTTKAPLPVGLAHSNGVGVIGGKVYISGGGHEVYFDRFDQLPYTFAYDPLTDTWTRKANLPHRMSDGVTGVIDGKLHVLTGVCADCSSSEPDRRFYRYDPATNTWSFLHWAPHQHATGAGGVINGKFYVVGGWDGLTASNQLDVYDPVTTKWTTRAPMPTARAWVAGTVLNNKLYVIGGQAATELATVEVYDPMTNTWIIKAPMPTPREQLAAATITAYGNSKILALGGLYALDVVEAYKP